MPKISISANLIRSFKNRAPKHYDSDIGMNIVSGGDAININSNKGVVIGGVAKDEGRGVGTVTAGESKNIGINSHIMQSGSATNHGVNHGRMTGGDSINDSISEYTIQAGDASNEGYNGGNITGGDSMNRNTNENIIQAGSASNGGTNDGDIVGGDSLNLGINRAKLTAGVAKNDKNATNDKGSLIEGGEALRLLQKGIAEHKNLQQELIDLNEKIDKLEQELESKNKTLDKQQVDLDSNGQELLSIKSEYDKINIEHEKLKLERKEKESRIGELKKEIDAKSDEINNLKEDVKKRDKKIVNMEIKCQQEKNKIIELQKQLSEKKEEVNQIKIEADKLESKNDVEQQEKIKKLSQKIKGKEDEISNLKKELNQSTIKNDLLQQELDGEKELCKKITDKLEIVQQSLADINEATGKGQEALIKTQELVSGCKIDSVTLKSTTTSTKILTNAKAEISSSSTGSTEHSKHLPLTAAIQAGGAMNSGSNSGNVVGGHTFVMTSEVNTTNNNILATIPLSDEAANKITSVMASAISELKPALDYVIDRAGDIIANLNPQGLGSTLSSNIPHIIL